MRRSVAGRAGADGGAFTATVFLGDDGVPASLEVYPDHRIVIGAGDEGATPGPGTFGVVARVWM